MFKKILSAGNRQLLAVVVIIGLAVALSRLISDSRSLPPSKPSEARLPVSVREVVAAPHVVTIHTTGRVVTRTTVTLTPEVSGRVDWLRDNFYAGSTFNAGEALLRIDKSDYLNAVAREKAAVAGARTAIAVERAEAEAALIEWRDLNGEQPAPPLLSRVPQIAQAEAELEAARARLTQAELELQRTEYQLPFAGRVLSNTLEPGSYVRAGQNYGEVYNLAALEVGVALSKAQMDWLQAGGSAQIVLDGVFNGVSSGSRRIAAEVLRLAAELDAQTRFQQVALKPVEVDYLLPGMLVEVEINSAAVPDTWSLPLAALQPGGMVWTVDPDQRLRQFEPDVVATLPDRIIVRAPAQTGRVVSNLLSGGIDGASVLITRQQAENHQGRGDG